MTFMFIKLLLTIVITLILSVIGAAMILGARLMIDKARRERNAKALRIWHALGVVVCLIPLMLVAGLGLAVAGQRTLGGIAATVAGSHLLWVAAAATIATAVLVFSGDLGNDANSWWRFRKTKIVLTETVTRHREVYRVSDAAGVHAGMELAQGTKLYRLTYGEPPVLPPLDRDVEQFLRDRFFNALPPRSTDESDDPQPEGAPV